MKHFLLQSTDHYPITILDSTEGPLPLLFHLPLDISNSIRCSLASATRHIPFIPVQQSRPFIRFTCFLDVPYLTNSNSLVRRNRGTLGNNNNSPGMGTAMITRFECRLTCCPRFASTCTCVSSWGKESAGGDDTGLKKCRKLTSCKTGECQKKSLYERDDS